VRARRSAILALAAALLSTLTVACGKSQEIDPLQLDGSRLTVNNRTKDDWKDVQVEINRQYRIAAPSVLAGQRLDATLDAFLDVYGNHFYYKRQQIRDVHLTAKSASGTPVDLHMDFHRSGLDGLADTGIFKKKEKQ
jgi:hypothetical protein